MPRIMRGLLCVVVVAGGCAGVMRALNDDPPPAAETNLGKSAAQHYAEALAAETTSPLATVMAAERAADQCNSELTRLTSISRGGGAFIPLYNADVETLATVRGPRTITAVSHECSDLAQSLRARVASLTAPPPPSPAEVAQARERELAARTVPEFDTTAEQLEQYVGEQTTGYRATAKLHGTLDAVSAWEVQVRRGTCYELVWRVDVGAALGDAARRGVYALVQLPGRPASLTNVLHGPGGVIHLFCPYQAGTAVVLLSVHGSRTTELGHGGLTVQVYEKTVTEAEVVRLEQDEARAKAFHQQRTREICARCERQRDRCLEGGQQRCSSDYDWCLEGGNLRREDCH